MTEHSSDGQPIQAGVQHRSAVLTGNVPSYMMFGLHEMVVIDRKYVKQEGNRSRAQVMYTCRDIVTGDVIVGCRRLDVMAGLTNGDDNVLHPATKLRAGAPGKFNRQTPANDSDGDRVLVGFIDGSRQRPVIMGVFRHSFATYGAQESNGERRLTQHQGTTIEIKDNGEYVITGVSGTALTVAADGTYTIAGVANVSIDGTQLKLGASAIQPVIRGTDFNASVLTPISTAAAVLLGVMATIPGLVVPPTPPNLAAASTAIAAAVGAFSTALQAAIGAFPSSLSNKVKAE